MDSRREESDESQAESNLGEEEKALRCQPSRIPKLPERVATSNGGRKERHEAKTSNVQR
jgi:hypothetical protein